MYYQFLIQGQGLSASILRKDSDDDNNNPRLRCDDKRFVTGAISRLSCGVSVNSSSCLGEADFLAAFSVLLSAFPIRFIGAKWVKIVFSYQTVTYPLSKTYTRSYISQKMRSGCFDSRRRDASR